MRKQEKARWIQERLNELFPNPPIPLNHKDPFTLLIAVLLSAQCTDAVVNKVTPGLFAKADNPKDMLKIGEAEILTNIRSCGLSPKKSKAIFGLSKILLDKHQGKVPKNFADLEELPGVGHKTASVVLSHAFQIPTFPVDTHIHRLAQRWGLSSGKSVEQTELDLKRLWPEKDWEKLHLQIIYYGRAYCPARGHSMDKCVICWGIKTATGKKTKN